MPVPPALPLEVRELVVPGEGGHAILALDTLDVAAGSILGVSGPSGAGKSTLIFALAGLAPGASGRIAWGQVDILGMPRAERTAFRARALGLVFQDFLLFDELDATANSGIAALFAPTARRASIVSNGRAALGRLGVPTGRRAALLSGGERQRIAFARATAHDPGALLADEPTASLHSEAAAGVMEALVSDRGRTRIVASHDARFLARADHVLQLAGGLARDA